MIPSLHVPQVQAWQAAGSIPKAEGSGVRTMNTASVKAHSSAKCSPIWREEAAALRNHYSESNPGPLGYSKVAKGQLAPTPRGLLAGPQGSSKDKIQCELFPADTESKKANLYPHSGLIHQSCRSQTTVGSASCPSKLPSTNSGEVGCWKNKHKSSQ